MRVLVWIGFVAIALGGLWWWLKPAQPPRHDAAPIGSAVKVNPAVALEARYRVVGGQVVEGQAGLGVEQGTAIRLVVESDRADELHLHGYDLHLDLQPGVPATLAFDADIAGRFEFELHGAHLSLGTLVVAPR